TNELNIQELLIMAQDLNDENTDILINDADISKSTITDEELKNTLTRELSIESEE
ncbi:15692_t:CDS:1, partial [Racocetra persica]